MTRSRWVALRAPLRAAFRTGWVHRLNVATAVFGLLLQVWLLGMVWRSVYADASQVRGIEVGQAVSYAVLAVCIQVALMPWDFSSLIQRVRSGQVGIDMIRPVGLLPQVLAHNVGTFLAQLPVAVLGIVWGIAIGALSLPPSVAAAVPWVLATALGVVLTLLMNLLMSMACFWSLEIGGYLMLYRLGSALLSGALIDTSRIIHSGEFDQVLIRPTGVFLQVVTRRFNILTVGDGVLGVVALVGFAVVSPVEWTWWRLAFVLAAVVGGGLVETSIQVVIAAVAFRSGNVFALQIQADRVITLFGIYPLTIFGTSGLLTLCLVFPLGLIAYLPTAALLGRVAEVPLPAWLVWGSPLAGWVLFPLAVALFQRRSRAYTSPGA